MKRCQALTIDALGVMDSSGAPQRQMSRPDTRVFLAGLVLFLILASAGSAAAHGGYPLRLGIRQDANLSLLAQTVLVYLREGQGMTVHPTFDGSGRELREE